MKLSEMTVAQLKKKAHKLGINPAHLTEQGLRNEIRRKLKASKGDDDTTSTATDDITWPSAWLPEMRETYYLNIVGEPMPENDAKAYKKLVAACDIKVSQAEFIQEPLGGVPVPVEGILPTPMGADCYGRFFSPDMETCMGGCPHMPLCKAICERRPDIAEAIDAIPDTLKGLHGVSKEDALSALQATEAAPKKGGKKAKKAKGYDITEEEGVTKEEDDFLPAASTGAGDDDDTVPELDDAQRYKWCGKVKSFDHGDQGQDELEMIRWLAKCKNRGFTLAEFTKHLDDSYDNGEEIARDLLTQLLEMGSIKAID